MNVYNRLQRLSVDFRQDPCPLAATGLRRHRGAHAHARPPEGVRAPHALPGALPSALTSHSPARSHTPLLAHSHILPHTLNSCSHAHRHTFTLTHPHTRPCILTHMHTLTHVPTHTFTLSPTHSVHTLTPTHIHPHTRSYLHTHTVTPHTHIHTHTLTQTHSPLTRSYTLTHTTPSHVFLFSHSHSPSHKPHTRIHTHTLTLTHIHTHPCSYSHPHLYGLTHMFPHIHSHSHTQSHPFPRVDGPVLLPPTGAPCGPAVGFWPRLDGRLSDSDLPGGPGRGDSRPSLARRLSLPESSQQPWPLGPFPSSLHRRETEVAGRWGTCLEEEVAELGFEPEQPNCRVVLCSADPRDTGSNSDRTTHLPRGAEVPGRPPAPSTWH